MSFVGSNLLTSCRINFRGSSRVIGCIVVLGVENCARGGNYLFLLDAGKSTMKADAKSLIANAWSRFTMLKLHAGTGSTSAFVNSKMTALSEFSKYFPTIALNHTAGNLKNITSTELRRPVGFTRRSEMGCKITVPL